MVQDGIDLDTGGVGLALGLHGQQQGGDIGRSDIGHLQFPQGGVDPVVETSLVGAPAILAPVSYTHLTLPTICSV